MPLSPVASRWSTERAPSSIASSIAPCSENWSRVQAEVETRVPAGLEVPPRLLHAERPALDEDVGRVGDPRRFGQDLLDREVEVRVRVGGFRRDRVRAEPGRNSALSADRAQGCELGVAIEPVARLPLEGRRARVQHPRAMAADRVVESVPARGSSRADRRQDSAASRMQRLVARAARAQVELPRTIAREAEMRMAVDKPWDRAEPPPVHFLHVAVQRAEVAHAADLGDAAVLTEDERILEDVDLAERRAPQGRVRSCRRRDLAQVAHEHARGLAARAHSEPAGRIGGSRPPSAAASTASS